MWFNRNYNVWHDKEKYVLNMYFLFNLNVLCKIWLNSQPMFSNLYQKLNWTKHEKCFINFQALEYQNKISDNLDFF